MLKKMPDADGLVKKYVEIVRKISIDKWILMGAAGLVLVLCSDSCQSDNNTAVNNNKDKMNQVSDVVEGDDIDSYVDRLENELEDILMSVEGAGAVKVMITLENSATKQVLMEEPYTENRINETDSEGGIRDNVEKSYDYRVIYEENSAGDTIPFVITEGTPDVAGVAVVAQGGDSALVKEKITGIIKALFGIEINKIAVGKMK